LPHAAPYKSTYFKFLNLTSHSAGIESRPPSISSKMSGAVAKRRLEGLSQQLVAGIPEEGTFENIPRIRHIASTTRGDRVRGKVVIVTGCNSPIGIGRASAHQFAAQGARAVFICDFATNYLDVHAREMKELYPDIEILARQIDVGEEEQVKKVCEEAIEKFGRLDVMFANAGVSGVPSTFDKVNAQQFMATMRVNGLGVFLCAKYAAIAMQKTSKEKEYPGGSIIGTASVAGIRSNAGSTDYSASKAVVVSLAQTMSYQLTGTGVRVNAICPGVIETGMTRNMYEAARSRGTERKIGQLNPLRRGAVPDEVARVALFLGSDEASYVNGQAWAVCGGLSAGHPFVPGKLA
jgi:NAD(P)-dependent dehydrogenase (short-subunit alcohol dehydrogenase family)